MDHVHFKANQTAAGYVAGGLDDSMEEAFELHLMGCSECIEDVEIWRAIKLEMPKMGPKVRGAEAHLKSADFGDWRMAASLVGVGVIGAAGGWLGKANTTPDLDSTKTVVFNLPSVSRGADECAGLRLAADTQVALVRVAGISGDSHVVALDSEMHALPASQYASRSQPDGSQLVRLNSSLLVGRAVHLEIHRANGLDEPLGCVIGENAEPGK